MATAAATTTVVKGVCATGSVGATVASSSSQKATTGGCQNVFWGAKLNCARFSKAAVSTSGRAATMPVVEASRVDRFSKDDIIVSPSILSANFARLGEQVANFTTTIMCSRRRTFDIWSLFPLREIFAVYVLMCHSGNY
jgi:hypothetical protein